MPIDQTRSTRKVSGGRLKTYRKSRQYSQGNKPILTQIGATKRRTVRKLGGAYKQRLLNVDTITVTDPKTGKATQQTIQSVVDNTANPNFIRRNIITKGALVATKVGTVRITSRPGQVGSVCGVLVK